MSADRDETRNADSPTHRGSPLNVGLTLSSPWLVHLHGLTQPPLPGSGT